MKRAVDFLFEIGMLKRTPRTGFQFLGTGAESVADHSFRTALIGYTLGCLAEGADPARIALMCLFHDLPEARTADHNYVNKRYVRVDEARALEDQVEGLPFGDDITAMFKEFNGCDTLEARLAKDADQLDLILELKAQLDSGNPNASDWLTYAVQRLSSEAGKAMAEVILSTHSTDWWFDKETDWWVNGSIDSKRS
ncbi:MAG TPA: HD domain-containing protein [Desulfobacteraceae bacterium]|nr:HD domain-containing protein [Desulfobacteraceae bacterium]